LTTRDDRVKIVTNLQRAISNSIGVSQLLLADTAALERLSQLALAIFDCFEKGNKLLIAGNGGSAADAQHFAAELVGRFKGERKGLPAIALTTDTSIITAWSNDYSFDTLFSRQIEALGKPQDMFVAFSTSGNSENIIKGLKRANEMNLITACLLGNGGGSAKGLCRFSVIVPSGDTARIQEAHILLIHLLCEQMEELIS
jgi:D-sedoheptulose 7-phosphate isomerase